MDHEERAWTRIRREARGLSAPEENQALEWLATRLRRIESGSSVAQVGDWHTVAAWESTHWPKLKAALQNIDPRDHTAIDRACEKYARKNGLLVDTAGAADEDPLTGRNSLARKLLNAIRHLHSH